MMLDRAQPPIDRVHQPLDRLNARPEPKLHRFTRQILLFRLIRQFQHHPLAELTQVGAELLEDLDGDAVALVHHAKQEVAGADVVIAALQGLAQRKLQALLGPRRERDVPGWRLLAPADQCLDLSPYRLQGDVR